MPHVRATPANAEVELDNGVTVTPLSSINVDVTLPLAAAAKAAGKIEEIDGAAAPTIVGIPKVKGSRGSGAALLNLLKVLGENKIIIDETEA